MTRPERKRNRPKETVGIYVEAQRRVNFNWTTCRPAYAERWAVVRSKTLGQRRITLTLLSFPTQELAEAAMAGMLRKHNRRGKGRVA